jgi:hypothetical protein
MNLLHPMIGIRRPHRNHLGELLMNPISSLERLAGLLTAFVLTTALGLSTAGAQTTHPLDGNARFQIGNGLPIPITLQPAPNGPVEAIDGATLAMTSPQGAITIKPSMFTHAGTPKNQPVFFANPQVFQVATSIPINFPRPGSTAVIAPSGRTGADVVTFCPGDVVTASNNPMCPGPSTGVISGLMRYTRTGGELGGTAVGVFGGQANIALRVTSGAPCAYATGVNPACKAIFALATPAGTGVWGANFGAVAPSPGGIPSPGKFYATIGGLGTILGVTATGLGPGLPNPATSYGGPWTAGTLTVSITDNAGASTEVFVLSGMDTRDPITGQGTINLVSGTVSDRSLSAPNANRGWLNLEIKPPFGVVPAMTTPVLAAAIGLIALVGAYFVRKRF